MVVAFLLAAFLIGYTLSQSNPPTPDAETQNQRDTEEPEAKSKEQSNIPHFVDPQQTYSSSLANISNGLATQNANLQKERDAAAVLKIKQDMEAVALMAEKKALQLEAQAEAQAAYTVRLERDKRERACIKQKATMLLKQGNVIAAVTNPTLGPQTREVPIQIAKEASNAALSPKDVEDIFLVAMANNHNEIERHKKMQALAKQQKLEEEAKHEEVNAGLESRQTSKVANHTTWDN